MTPVEVALAYLDAGLSVIPIKTDGSKSPAVKTWKPYQSERMGAEEAARHWGCAAPPGYGIVGGAVSGNLEVIDFDDADAWTAFDALARSAGRRG